MVQVENMRNEQFSADRAVARLAPALAEWMQWTSRDGYSLSSTDRDELDSGEARAVAFIAEGFAMMREQLAARRHNLNVFENVEVVSLGEDCLSRAVLTRWGIKRLAKLGERSAPFDLSVHRIGATTELVRSNFAGYLDPANLYFDASQNFCMNRRFKSAFNHETGSAYAENGFARLIECYATRLAHFRDVMASEKPTALVFHGCQPRPDLTADAVLQLWDAIVARWGGANKHLICVNTWPHGAEIVPMVSPLPDRIAILDIAYPCAGYVWHLPKYCFTRAGFDFERQVTAFIEQQAEPLIATANAIAAMRAGAA